MANSLCIGHRSPRRQWSASCSPHCSLGKRWKESRTGCPTFLSKFIVIEDKAFESDAHVKNWLIRVTVNRCKNVLRAPWHKAEDIADYENTLVFDQPQYRELFEAVMSLDRRYRLPVLLYYYEGYRQREIAGLLGIPEETVRTRLARAREKLKHILSEVPQYA